MLNREKADQAQALVKEMGLDCWLTFVRETGAHPDPGLELILGIDLTWRSALILGAKGERVAIVGRFDVSNVRETGVFQDIIGYDEGIRDSLVSVLSRLDPQRIGLNFSTDDTTADGLTHGMWLSLNELLGETPYVNRLTSAGPLLAKLRARKSATEIERLRGAIATTEEIVGLMTKKLRPGLSECDLADFVHDQFRQRGVPSAWDWNACPIVNCGPHSEPGHAKPRADLKVEPGQLVHIDLGVRQDGFCSDLQRMWYVRRPGETAPPKNIQRAWATVLAAIDAGAALLKPGSRGHEVDAAARKVIVDAGFEEFKHGFGHGLGRAVHDGGTLLGPRWEKYGKTPDGVIEPGNVFTVELGVTTEAGYIGMEEDVLVTESGCKYLSTPQRELMLI